MSSSNDKRGQLIATLSEAGGRLSVRNIMHPILWLCGIVAVPSIFAISYNPHTHWAVPVLLCTVVLSAVGAFIYLLIFDRDRLQSEEYLLHSRRLDLIEQKGSKKVIDAAAVEVMTQSLFLGSNEKKGGGS